MSEKQNDNSSTALASTASGCSTASSDERKWGFWMTWSGHTSPNYHTWTKYHYFPNPDEEPWPIAACGRYPNNGGDITFGESYSQTEKCKRCLQIIEAQ